MDPQRFATVLNTLMVEPNVYGVSTVKEYIVTAMGDNPPKTYDDVLFGTWYSSDEVWAELDETFRLNGLLGPDPADEDGSELIIEVVLEYLGLN
jgi:hypothetical protein